MQGPSGDDTMDVERLGKRLPPGMEEQGDAEVAQGAWDLALRARVRPPLGNLGQVGDGAERVGLRAFGQTANHHIVGHVGAEGAHTRRLAVSDTPSHMRCGVLPTALTHTHSRNIARRKGEMA